ncbi:MAG: PilT/PilU family type 4a pilus ATPase [Phycisphaerales bacterium]|nr:PilT/PilU family type 4a pilus ATPase [Phycisphaerales bacterium]
MISPSPKGAAAVAEPSTKPSVKLGVNGAATNTSGANRPPANAAPEKEAKSMNRTAEHQAEQYAPHVTLDPDQKHDPHATRFGKFLQAAIKFEASDLIIKSGQQPKIRLRGALKPLDTPAVTGDEFMSIAQHILSEEQWKDLHRLGSVDFAYDYDDHNRFRVNLFQARGKLSVACRLITSKIRRFEELYLPSIMAEIAMQPQGIVLLCGVTGSGKSTTIAAMLDYVNERKSVHIVTIEDPIEYIFTDKKATINQREIGIDVLDFKIALRALVRENPDVVLVGEMRDSETFEAALHAAETGHLVFGTIHSSSTTQTFSRIYDLFAHEERDQVRKILAYQMRAFVYQKLLPTLHEKIHRIPALEILINNGVARKYILEGREGELREYLMSVEATQQGMIDFNGSLVKLVEDEYIHMRVAMEATPNPDELMMRLKKLG